MNWLNGQAAAMWNAANSRIAPRRKGAIIYWSRRLIDLPGPIFFTLDPRDMLNGKRQAVLANSKPLCACGARRWFIPARPQDFHKPTRLNIVSLSKNNPPLTITLWGGDASTSVIELSIVDGQLASRLAPHNTNMLTFEPLDRLSKSSRSVLLPRTTQLAAGYGSADTFELAAYALRSTNPEKHTASVVISRICKPVDRTSNEPPHICA